MWILLSQLANGGLERVQINLASELRGKGINVSIVAGKVLPHFSNQADLNIPIVELSRSSKLLFPYFLLKAIHREKPLTIMTTSNDVSCMVIFINLFLKEKINLIISHHTPLSEPIKKAKKLQKIKLTTIKLAMQLLYPYASSIVAVSSGVANDISKSIKINREKIKIIHNPIITKNFYEKANEDSLAIECFNNNYPVIVYAGRICPEKRLDIVVQAIKKIAAIKPINLLILGDGPNLDQLKSEITFEHLEHSCFLTGFVENPLPLIKKSDVLILASDYEGFGNVLVEAMACKTQVISTDCPYGPAEILADNKYGQLIPTNDSDALSAAILNVLDGHFFIDEKCLESRAMEFTSEASITKYLALIKQ